ncbi:hypothetical protein ACI394_29850, partial [Klebsiella pneumoniae]|uniref:hypothetical protein n=1 Tax=Klebsiella pneumoniae TaxID=573 RepID=UPI0038528608
AEYDAEIQGHQIQKRFGTRPATTSIIVPGYPIGAGATNWSFLGLITPYAPNYSIWADNISGTATLTRNNQVIGTVGQLIY